MDVRNRILGPLGELDRREGIWIDETFTQVKDHGLLGQIVSPGLVDLVSHLLVLLIELLNLALGIVLGLSMICKSM